MDSIKNIIDGLDWSYLTNILMTVIPALFCISVHEMSHGLAAYMLGDKTAKSQKRISLNPMRHIDPIGLLMLVVFKFGWAKPVSVNMRNFKNPKRDMALSALAGPVSNIIFACILLFVRGLLFVPLMKSNLTWLMGFINTTAVLSIYLGIFNLIPIPPLDGSKVLFAFLPNSAYAGLMQYERYGMILLIVLLITGVLSGPLNTIFTFVISKLEFLTVGGFNLYRLFL